MKNTYSVCLVPPDVNKDQIQPHGTQDFKVFFDKRYNCFLTYFFYLFRTILDQRYRYQPQQYHQLQSKHFGNRGRQTSKDTEAD